MSTLRTLVEKFEAEVERVRAEMKARVDPAQMSNNEFARRIALLLYRAARGEADAFDGACKVLRLFGDNAQKTLDALVTPVIQRDHRGIEYSSPTSPLSDAFIAHCNANGVPIAAPAQMNNNEFARRIALLLYRAARGEADAFDGACKVLRLFGDDAQKTLDALVASVIQRDHRGVEISSPTSPLSDAYAFIAHCKANGVPIERMVATVTPRPSATASREQGAAPTLRGAPA
jgi:major membrane immunogen (membrane-anchored lipoprotein)